MAKPGVDPKISEKEAGTRNSGKRGPEMNISATKDILLQCSYFIINISKIADAKWWSGLALSVSVPLPLNSLLQTHSQVDGRFDLQNCVQLIIRFAHRFARLVRSLCREFALVQSR